jgi:2-dehydro-3-deoxyphosphogluconate aldolase/(4S)-4-hydroxy-2-oxoglutarate aldolase
MNSAHALAQIESGRLMAGMRGRFGPETALAAADVLMHAGIAVFELTTNSEQPFEAMQALKRAYGDAAVVGMGTVLDAGLAARAIDCGADFVVAPSFSRAVLERAQAADVLAIPGVITPTECVDAWTAGARLLKLFPIGTLGLDYFRTIRGPLDHYRYICNGGMDGTNAPQFIAAGAAACGMAAWLTGDGTMPLTLMAERARQLREAVPALA